MRFSGITCDYNNYINFITLHARYNWWDSQVQPGITLLYYIICKLQLMRFSGTIYDYVIYYIIWLHYIQIAIDEILRYNLWKHTPCNIFTLLDNITYKLQWMRFSGTFFDCKIYNILHYLFTLYINYSWSVVH